VRYRAEADEEIYAKVSDDLRSVPPKSPKSSWGCFSRSPKVLESSEMERMK
jgi:hypothetical protein